ncbi:MAG TPA: prenyltransferase/squalene oxidase repeat-containing protein [Thermomicrobiales bacterium]|nr:prenyltransferase/squalene oxidase repeat-containing protein [Thermomicrobiales bacterium]
MDRARVAYRRPIQMILVVALALWAFIGTAAVHSDVARSATPAASPVASPVSGSDLERAVAYLEGQQAEDGGFPGFEGTSDPGLTTDAVIALAAAREAGVDVAESIDAALAFLTEEGLAYAETGAGQRAKLILAVIAAGADPTAFAGQDLVAPLFETLPETGISGSGLYDRALATLAAAAVGSDQAATLAERFSSYQIADGSWAFDASTEPGSGDTNTTALVVQALVAAGMGNSPAIANALAYLGMAQAPGGGFAYQPADPLVPDANSTALAIQALIAAGTDISGGAAGDAMQALAAFQNPSGGFRYTEEVPDDNLFATVQAIPALAGWALPILPDGATATPVASPFSSAA